MKVNREINKAARLYRDAEQTIHDAGFGWEPDWQRKRVSSTFTEPDLLREAAWVVLCSGFREAIVRRVFDYVSLCFCDWESASAIIERRRACVETASWKFRNERKLHALADIAEIVHQEGFPAIIMRLQMDPIRELQSLPFIGPVTSWHLAKNLGFDVAKNDRHLAKLAVDHGYSNAHELCKAIADSTGELTCVIDVVLWRYSILRNDKKYHYYM